MTRNMNNTDRAIRAAVGAALVAAAVWAGVTSLAGLVLLAFAAVMLGTATVAVCPLYSVLGISTEPAPHRTRRHDVGAVQKS